MPYVGSGQSNNRPKLDGGLATTLCDNPSVLCQLGALALAAPLHGFYFQFGTNKAQTSYMFALKHSDPERNVIFYAADYTEFVKELTDTMVIISEKYKSLAATLQFLNVALKGTLKDVWDEEHDRDVSNIPLTK